MTNYVAIVGSSTWPTPHDISQYVGTLPDATIVVTDDRAVVGGLVSEAATRRGLRVVIVTPNRQRDGDAASFRQAEAIAHEAARLVAFAAKDPKTKQISEGTALRIRLAERRGIPVEVIETPVPGAVCSLIARVRHRYEGIRDAPTPGYAAYRVKSAGELVAELVVTRAEYDRRLVEGWEEIDGETDAAEVERKTDAWVKWLRTYEIVSDVIEEALIVLRGAPLYAPAPHRQSMHRMASTELVACP